MNYLVFSVFLFCLLIYNACTENAQESVQPKTRMLKGYQARLGRFGYQVSLQVRGRNVCGGAIVDDLHIITAAHCFANETAFFFNQSMKAVAGVVDLNKYLPNRVEVDIERIHIPLDYFDFDKKKHTIGDIAVAKLRYPLNITDNSHLKKLELPKDEKKSYDGEAAIVTGFGWNWIKMFVNKKGQAYEKGDGDKTLRYAFTHVINFTECQSKYQKIISRNHICAQIWERPDGIDGVCDGDSGGPLVHMDTTLIAVVRSSPILCNERAKPSLYTRVTSYLDFIDKALRNATDPDAFAINLPISQ